MVIDTKIYLEHEDLALSDTIRQLDGVEMGVVSDASTDPEHAVSFFWIEAPDFDLLEDVLDSDHTVSSYTVVVSMNGSRTYRIEYSDDAKLVSPAVVSVGGITREATAYMNGWKLHLELPDHQALLDLNEYTDEGFRLDVLEIHNRDQPIEEDRYGLTDAQRATLVGAVLQGYYDDPRRVNQEELAEILGISSSALSGRIRRGAKRLIEAVLVDGDGLDTDVPHR